MSQYPINTPEGLYEAVNYLASGPSGLGQNFAGFSSYQTAYLTGNFRLPYTSTASSPLYVAPIALSNAQALDPYTVKFTFTTPQASPPFIQGQGFYVSGVVDSPYTGNFDGDYTPIGVVSCTTTYVIAKTQRSFNYGVYASGGTVEYNANNVLNSTDCNARVTTTSATDRVFVAGQLNNRIAYTASAPTNATYTVQINRYTGTLSTTVYNPDYRFATYETIAEKTYTYTALSGTSTFDVETIFSTVIDQPSPGYYWYILEVQLSPSAATLVQTSNAFGLRALTAQVVKQ
jgi:hypothetical protein